MKSIKLILCLMLSFIFSQGALDQYDIPEYEYKTFQLSGNDLFNSFSNGDETMTTINMGANYMSMSQSPARNCMYGFSFDYNSDSYSYDDPYDSEWDEDTETTNWTMTAPFAFDQYFNDDTKGMFGFAEGSFDTFGGDDADGIDDTSDLFLTIGAGYGRVVSARPVAQAYAIADALGIDADDDTIMAIASVIGSAASYESIYKDDAIQQYYNDLAEATGVDGSAMQIQKVLTSPAYNVSDRFTGWDVKAGITNNYMQCDECDDKGSMMLEANYAMPMDMDSQLMISFGYISDLNDDDSTVGFSSPIYASLLNAFNVDEELVESGAVAGGWNAMSLGATYTKDHSYNWSTAAGFTYISETYSYGDYYDYYDYYGGNNPEYSSNATVLTVSTTKAILNQMSVTASFVYAKMGGDGFDDSDPLTEISTQVTYWVF